MKFKQFFKKLKVRLAIGSTALLVCIFLVYRLAQSDHSGWATVLLIFSLAVLAVINIWFYRDVTGPLSALTQSARNIADGSYGVQCRKFDDAVANGSWPIEEWVQHRRVSMSYFNEHDYYQVPAACLQSASIQNLFFAGRNISATEKAIASARVMGICLQTGYAAGCLAAAFANNQPQNEAVKQVQNGQL